MIIAQFANQGGPSPRDWAEVGKFGHVLGERGDRLLFLSKKQGETAKLFNRTARMIALLSYVPGGVETFGMRFDASSKPVEVEIEPGFAEMLIQLGIQFESEN